MLGAVASLAYTRARTESTIDHNLRGANELFDWLATRGKPLDCVGMTDIDDTIAAKKARRNYSRATMRIYGKNLRALFRFAEERRWCVPGVAAGIVPSRVYPDAPAPSASFPRLKQNEIKEYGEYRTQRYVLRAFDQLARGIIPDLSAEMRD